ncbi:uncharacterized protein C1orf198 homolog [Cotesia glomerata]|uniref:DUF4706 domain-containing protein n=1 Tax=Cotesia glomerata TaxID=32391 RepID=A0AAV7HE36_COTGL|nr:uncharacterized protein C1orf198 homolog [Cotesia glomerata]KAH0535379.1 hypothetical protein KQX54_016088 [Cotesia glomerata]
MSTKGLSSIAEDYFYSLNPLAKRIGDDVRATKEAYEGLWNTLSLKEKNQAIDETIIQPEIALKYTTLGTDKNKEIYDCYPKLRIQTGMKYVIDETGSTLKWRDEHSGPFSFMTQSQMNLHLLELPSEIKTKLPSDYADKSPHFLSPIKINESSFDSSSNDYSPTSTQVSLYQSESFSDSVYSNVDSTRINNCASIDNTGNIFTKLMNKTSILKMNQPDDDLESLVPQKQIVISKISGSKNGNSNGNAGTKNQMNINLNHRAKSDASESTALLETPSSYNSFQFLQSNPEEEIPKTGFEFLDNW